MFFDLRIGLPNALFFEKNLVVSFLSGRLGAPPSAAIQNQ